MKHNDSFEELEYEDDKDESDNKETEDHWKGWNYNVGHDEYIQDIKDTHYKVDVVEPDIVMIYDPNIDKYTDGKAGEYNIKAGTYRVNSSNELNVKACGIEV